MAAKLQSLWQKIRKRRVGIIVIIGIIVLVIALIIIGYWFDWVGFASSIQVSTVHTISGPTVGTITSTESLQPGKTLWDWLQLLFIPIVLAIGGFFINLTISKGEQEATKQRSKTEREIADDNQKEEALQIYLNMISELLLHEKLQDSQQTDEVRIIRCLGVWSHAQQTK